MRNLPGFVHWLVAATFISALTMLGQHTRSTPAEHHPARTQADLLRESYSLGMELVPAQRAFLLFRLATVAEHVAPDLSKKWAKELFKLTFQLEPDWDRSALQKNAVVILASTDPEAAFRMHGMMSPLPNQAMFPEDLRADAAATVFLRYWDDKKSNGRIHAIRIRAQTIAKDGQYPYRAVSPILDYQLKRDETAGLAWVSEICSAYRQGNPNFRTANPEFVAFVREFWPKLSLSISIKRDLLTALIERLSRPDPEVAIYRAQVKASTGTVEFTSQNEQLLFQILPFVRELDSEWAERLVQDRPWSFRQALQSGVNTSNDVDALYLMPTESSDKAVTADPFVQRQQELGRVYDALGQHSGQSTGEAIQIAAKLTDADTHLSALESIATRLDDSRDTSHRAALEDQAKQILEGTQKLADKVRALALLAHLAALARNSASYQQYMDRGLDLGELLFEQFVQTHPTAQLEGAEILEPMESLVATGVRFNRIQTISRIEQTRDPLLAAYLLIAAAETGVPRRRSS